MIDYMEDTDLALDMLAQNWFCEDHDPGAPECTIDNAHALCRESNEYILAAEWDDILMEQAIAAAEWNMGL